MDIFLRGAGGLGRGGYIYVVVKHFPKILECLENETGEIIMEKETIDKARISVEKMTAVGR